ncbi:hypothetical protein WJX73_010700 [Symbiochloris irregularis]|uniref:RRM domain-containing protein n=1 Tax=Symbiochloris irregularis TaxID=706552 RepID=A0AAW1NSA3_9CHLO
MTHRFGQVPVKCRPKRPKHSRWAAQEEAAAVVPGLALPVSLPASLAGLVDANPQAMLLHRQLSTISQQIHELDTRGLVAEQPESERSPSPQPQYDEEGMRSNTRAQRLKQKLTGQAQDVVTELIKISPSYKPPPEFRPPKKQRKIYVPVQQYPGYNFIGLIIGPRGNTQKRMQQESGAKIALRGKGSVKDGRTNRSFDPSDNEELHVMVTADNDEALEKAADMIQQLLVPLEEGVNQHKRLQLRELAELNGTLRETELQELRSGDADGAPFQLPPSIQEAAARQYDRDVAAVHPDAQHEPLDSAYNEFIQELGHSPAPWADRNSEPAHSGTLARDRDDRGPNNLFVGCVPAGMDEGALRALFEPSGQVADCHLVFDRATGQHRGFGFVRMAHEQGALDAMQRLHNFMLGGRRLVVRRKQGPRHAFHPMASAPAPVPGPPAAAPAIEDRPPGMEEEHAEAAPGSSLPADGPDASMPGSAHADTAPPHSTYPPAHYFAGNGSGFMHSAEYYVPYSHPSEHPESLALAAQHAHGFPPYSFDQASSAAAVEGQWGEPAPPGAEDEPPPPGDEVQAASFNPYGQQQHLHHHQQPFYSHDQQQQPPQYHGEQQLSYATPEAVPVDPGTAMDEVPPPPPPPESLPQGEPPKRAVQVVKASPELSEEGEIAAEEGEVAVSREDSPKPQSPSGRQRPGSPPHQRPALQGPSQRTAQPWGRRSSGITSHPPGDGPAYARSHEALPRERRERSPPPPPGPWRGHGRQSQGSGSWDSSRQHQGSGLRDAGPQQSYMPLPPGRPSFGSRQSYDGMEHRVRQDGRQDSLGGPGRRDSFEAGPSRREAFDSGRRDSFEGGPGRRDSFPPMGRHHSGQGMPPMQLSAPLQAMPGPQRPFMPLLAQAGMPYGVYGSMLPLGEVPMIANAGMVSGPRQASWPARF